MPGDYKIASPMNAPPRFGEQGAVLGGQQLGGPVGVLRPPPLSWLLIAQLPQQLHGGPHRPWLMSVETAQAGDPIAEGRFAAGFPDHSRHA